MGPSNRGWLPTGTYLHPPPNKSTASNKMLTRKHGSNLRRGDRPDKQRGNYRDTSCPTELCLPNFSGGEKGWGPKACSESEVPEPVCENRALQDGGSPPAPRPASSTGLDGEVRPEGYLPSGPNSLNHQHLTFQWEGKSYMFKCLPFGLSSAPRVFTKLLNRSQWWAS